MWECDIFVSGRHELLKHFRLQHRNYGSSQRYPCAYLSCPCTFNEGKCSPAYGIKKPGKAEVNYYPNYPSGETVETLKMRFAVRGKEKKQ